MLFALDDSCYWFLCIYMFFNFMIMGQILAKAKASKKLSCLCLPMNIMFDSLKYVMQTSLVSMMLSRGSSTMGRRAVTGRGIHSVTQYTAINRIRNAHYRNINFGCVAYKIN